MNSFKLEVLALPTLVIILVTLLMSFRITRNPSLSIALSSIKSGFYMAYYGFYFDGTYTFLDDHGYLADGLTLLHEGVSIVNLLENLELLLTVGRGHHFLYALYNTYAFRFFGYGYYAPAALNVLLTLIIAFYGARLAGREFGMSNRGASFFYVFLVFHPDIASWSTIMNGKDILVLMCHVLLLTSISMYFRGNVGRFFFLATPVVLILLFLRFYVPLLFAFALAISVSFRIRRINYKHLFYSAALLFLAVIWIDGAGFQYVIDALQAHLVNPLYGFVRISLTPIPFNTEPSYAFLNLPALIHWLIFPFLIFGIYRAIQLETEFSRFFIVYLLVFVSLYATFGELQGPRHRVQLDYALAIFQFIGLTSFLKFSRPRSGS